MSETATLTALVHGKQTAVSFRHLSSLLNVPTRKAQTLLRNFAASDPTVIALWCVTEPHPKTGILRTSLTTSPPTDVKKQIWAVGPPPAANAVSQQAMWLVSDAARDRASVTEPSHVLNELRDGRWNRIKSPSSEWDGQLDPRLGGDESLANDPINRSSAKGNSSSLLASVKAKAKAKAKKTQARCFMGGTFKSSSSNSASLFASKPLGTGAVKKRLNSSKHEKEKEERLSKVKTESKLPKEEEQRVEKSKLETKNNGKKRTPSKKARKVVDDESENEDRHPPQDAEAEDDEEQKCRRELEREAAEKEKADAERAELEQELVELNRVDVDEDPESPELKEPADDYEPVSPVPRAEEPGCSPDSGKRLFWQTFGDGPNDSKRIRKEIEEAVEENGYLVTRRVVKIFDEHGNEVKDSETEKPPPEANHATNGTHSGEKTSDVLRLKTALSRRGKSFTASLKNDKAKDSKRPKSKLGPTVKKTHKKKTRGNIMSYFGKRA